MESFVNRVKNLVDICWNSFSAKVGAELIDINKEASMQLQFAYLLKNSLDLAIYHDDESINIELETSILIPIGNKECDIVLKLSKDKDVMLIPIELKCFKQFQPTGQPTGGYTQFRKNVHHDIFLLEQYALLDNFTNGIGYVMTDFVGIVNRNTYWQSNICNGTIIQNGEISNVKYLNTEPSTLTKNYSFNWIEKNQFYFLKLEPELID